MHNRIVRWSTLGAAALAVLAIAVPTALGRQTGGNPAAGKAAFTTSCGSCHTLKAAGSMGNIGPNLDKVKLTQAQIVTAITKGGKAVMTAAAAAKYKSPMPPYASLGSATINNIAAFVYASTH